MSKLRKRWSISKLLSITNLSAIALVTILSWTNSNIFAQTGETISESQSANSEITNWTKYTNNNIGISFEYPSSWGIEEKYNGSDVAVSGNGTRFSVSKVIDRPEDNPLTSSGLLDSVRILEERVVKHGTDTIIEPANVKKYDVGGERAGTFVTKHIEGNLRPIGLRTFMVFHNGDGYGLSFTAPMETFDSPESQDILNNIIQSFKFLE